MRPRASAVSICPSGVRRKMASGAGQLPSSCTTFGHSLLERGRLGLGRPSRGRWRCARRVATRSSSSRTMRADAEAEGVEIVRLLDAVVQDDELRPSLLVEDAACAASSRRAARAAGSGRRCRAGSPRPRSRASGAGAGLSSSTSRAPDEAAAEVGEREALRLERRRRPRRRRPRSRRATDRGCGGRP